ncbi:hypothetical protein [Streptomyces durmitorensis]|nr:hypothetical protein [Streptomyces durmitorensis]
MGVVPGPGGTGFPVSTEGDATGGTSSPCGFPLPWPAVSWPAVS